MKSEKHQKSDRRHLRKVAAEWVVKNEMGLTPHEQDEFNTWLTDDPRNREAYVSANRSWEDLDRLLGLQASYHAKADPDLFGENSSGLSLRRKKWFLAGTGLAASVLIIFALTPFLSHWMGAPKKDTIDRSDIVFSRIERLDLEDGSVVTLNHGSLVEPSYSEDERFVKLVQGEAIFEVEKDPNRPFIVEVSGIRVRAVGTAFNVKLSHNGVDVLVTEGVVALDASDGSYMADAETEPTLLEANHKATIQFAEDQTHQVSFEQVAPSEIEEQLLWKPVLLNFDDVPISQIVNEFNRRNPKKLVLVGSEWERIRLSSYFWSDNLDGFLRLLEQKYALQIVEAEDEIFYLSRSFKSYQP